MPPSVKRLVIQVIAGILYYSGLLRIRLLFRRIILRKREVCVLALHRVLSGEEANHANSLEGMVLKDVTFESMLDFISRNFRVISVEDFLRGVELGRADLKPWCLLTFDDGWRDNYTNAYPLLRKFKFPAAVFLVTGMVGTEGGFWVEQLRNGWKNPPQQRHMTEIIAEILPRNAGNKEIGLEGIVEFVKQMSADARAKLLQQLLPPDRFLGPAPETDRMMTWSEAAEMSRNGMEMGAHTVSHPILTHEDASTITMEVRSSKKTLAENLDRAGRAFAYPNGDWNERVRAEVQQAGYLCAFTTRRNWYNYGADLFTVPRIIIHEKKITGYTGKFSPAIFSLTLARQS